MVVEISAPDRASSRGQSRAWLRSLPQRIWLTLSAAWAVVTGLAPHILHHIGPLAGAALFAGVTGSLLFGALGLVLAIPFLRRMYRRFGNWRAPAVAIGLFVAVFSISTFVVGPQINSGSGSESATPASSPQPDQGGNGHEGHH